MKEVQRIRVINDGVAIAISLYHGKFFIAVLLGSVKGTFLNLSGYSTGKYIFKLSEQRRK